ncbi:hypothetical protein ZEAMMB73_Zm00001d037255 [Zea mays]|uniref:Uncharacterized protein n=1 Tax=Zea mays TaxID=4577 RepID=A0A1D6LW00_MAIZE|nr:hypothetical protein ZEAMMB73_Zm00001d037255 [Zea mays]
MSPASIAGWRTSPPGNPSPAIPLRMSRQLAVSCSSEHHSLLADHTAVPCWPEATPSFLISASSNLAICPTKSASCMDSWIQQS